MNDMNIDNVIYKWFDMKYQTYDKLETDESIYLYYEGDEYIDIMIDKKSNSIYYKWEFWEEFSGVFPIQRIYFEWIIFKWVGDTFNLKGFTPTAPPDRLLR